MLFRSVMYGCESWTVKKAELRRIDAFVEIERASCRERVETVSDFIFWDYKITADGDCSHEIKRRLLLGRKVMTNLDIRLKSRDITLPTKVCAVKALVFPVVMCGCESWTTEKAERRKIEAFELWC